MNDLLEGMIAYAREHNCSDIHLNVGGPAMIRANGVLREYPAFIKDTQTTEMIDPCRRGFHNLRRKAGRSRRRSCCI